MEFRDIIRLPQPEPAVTADVREVVRDVGKRPHVFVRVHLSGWYFPQRAPEPFMVIGKTVSRFVVINADGTADAYFDVKPPGARRVSFGYGRIISWDFDTTIASRIPRLDRKRLPKGTVDLTR